MYFGRTLWTKIIGIKGASIRVRDRLSDVMEFSDEDLLKLSDTDQLWLHTNPSGRMLTEYQFRRFTGYMRSFLEREMAVGLLGPKAIIDEFSYRLPSEKFEPLRSRLYTALVRRYDERTSVSYCCKYATEQPPIPYHITPKSSLIALYTHTLMGKEGIRPHMEVTKSFEGRDVVSVLDLGIGRSHIIDDVSRRLKKHGVKRVEKYGIALCALENMPKLSSPCFIGEFEHYDFKGQRFDLLFSNAGASYYTLRPVLFLDKLVSIMNDGARAWLHMYSYDDWRPALEQRDDIRSVPLKSVHELAKAFEFTDEGYLTDEFMHAFHLGPKVLLIKKQAR